MKKIAITGNIGVGKTTVSKLFSYLGIAVYQADKEGHRILNSSIVKQYILDTYGQLFFLPDGAVDRKKIGDIVFNNAKALRDLEDIVHPELLADFFQWSSQQQGSYVLFDAAIVFEKGWASYFDAIICVAAPPSLCLQRVMQREGVKESYIQSIQQIQWLQEEKLKKATYAIINDGNSLVIPQVLAIDKELRGMSSSFDER